ncbi:unnamed protein product, partial [Ectocarpus sp. 13 AM-2016]
QGIGDLFWSVFSQLRDSTKTFSFTSSIRGGQLWLLCKRGLSAHPAWCILSTQPDASSCWGQLRPMAPTPRRQWNGSAAAARLVLGLVLLLAVMVPTGASLFKRKRTNVKEVQPSGGNPFGKGGKGSKRGKVKEDVAWLLEDTSDGGWKPVRDDGHVQVCLLSNLVHTRVARGELPRPSL